jgi:hypothetical protein
MIVADEDVSPLDPEMAPEMCAFLWMVDITDERRPTPVGSFQVGGIEGTRNPTMTGCHQPIEDIRGTEIPAAWFANGVRFIDIQNPHSLRETAHFIPNPPPGEDRACTNDVFQDDRGLVYAIDRVRGLHILERI